MRPQLPIRLTAHTAPAGIAQARGKSDLCDCMGGSTTNAACTLVTILGYSRYSGYSPYRLVDAVAELGVFNEEAAARCDLQCDR